MIEDQQFVDALHASPLENKDLADALMVSRPTVERWKAGTSLPHQAMRPAVMKFLQGGQAGSTVHRAGCPCGFCKAGFTS